MPVIAVVCANESIGRILKLTAKKQETKRNRKCRICGSTKHKTPAHTKRGCVVYK